MTAKADRVRELMEHPDIQEAFRNVREFYRDKLEELPVDQSRGQEALYDIRKMLYLLTQVEQDLKNAIEHGNLKDFRELEQQRHSFLGDLTKWQRKVVR